MSLNRYRDYLPPYYSPIEHVAYKYPSYTSEKGYIWGKTDDLTIDPWDSPGIYDAFHTLHPSVESWREYSRHELREMHYAICYDKELAPVMTSNAIDLIANFLDIDISDFISPCQESLILTFNPVQTAGGAEFTKQCIKLSEKYGLISWQAEKRIDSIKYEEDISWIKNANERMGLSRDQAELYADLEKQNFLPFVCRDLDIINGLIILRSLYLVWILLFWAKDGFTKTGKEKVESELNSLLNCIGYEISDEEGKTAFSDYKRFVSAAYMEYIPESELKFVNDIPKVKFLYRSPLSAAIGGMLNLIISGDDSKAGGRIAVCEMCSSPYVKRHQRSKYCADCRTGAMRTRLWRSNKEKNKGGKRDGKKKTGQ
ncbi:MAG: hypothetical protein ACOX6Y_07810 [Christensenellales bacterium]